MPEMAPRISPRLLDVIERLAERKVPIAEINRLVGAEAARLALPRPSYERVRVLVHAARRLRRNLPPIASVAFDVATYTKPPDALVERFDLPRPRLRDRRL
jgi:hypothetical protein